MTEAGEGRTVTRAVHWRRLDTPGSEYFVLTRRGSDWELKGTVVATLDDEPVLARYTVLCGAGWEVKEADAVTDSGGATHRLHLVVDGGRWTSDGREIDALEGAIDVDLGVTPSTNTLPIRRLGLEIGQEADLAVAWVRFPDLSVERWRQRYTRLSENVYRYQSDSFSRDIEVDDLGLVVHYPDLFIRESALSG